MQKYDSDGDGRISRDEFFDVHVEASAVLEYEPWIPQTQPIPRSILRAVQKLEKSDDTAEIKEVGEQIFDFLDRNVSGFISKDEISYFVKQQIDYSIQEEAKLLQHKREQLYSKTKEVVETLMNSLDFDQDGKVSREEYLNHYLE